MVSNFGISTCNGSGYTRGRGIVRSALGSLAGVAGRALLNKIVSSISGGSTRRRTYRKRTTTHRRGGSYKPIGLGQRTYCRKTIGTTRKHRKVGGYKKRPVGRPRKVGRPRISAVRRHRRY